MQCTCSEDKREPRGGLSTALMRSTSFCLCGASGNAKWSVRTCANDAALWFRTATPMLLNKACTSAIAANNNGDGHSFGRRSPDPRYCRGIRVEFRVGSLL
jgi:hypothetical protein